MSAEENGANGNQSKLAGNTLRTYLFVLKYGRVGIRQTQRALGFSNPSLAQYHLSKLTELGFLERSDPVNAYSDYSVVKNKAESFIRERLQETLWMMDYLDGKYKAPEPTEQSRISKLSVVEEPGTNRESGLYTTRSQQSLQTFSITALYEGTVEKIRQKLLKDENRTE